jgi:hypothetical protein
MADFRVVNGVFEYVGELIQFLVKVHLENLVVTFIDEILSNYIVTNLINGNIGR